MNSEEIIKILGEIAEGHEKLSAEVCARADLKAMWEGRAKGIRQAIAMLKANLGDKPNDPLTLEELREMAWKQAPIWCRDADGINAGLLCIQDDWYTSERTPHIWLLDEEGNSGVYSVESLIQAGAIFYRLRPEEEK